MCVLSGTFIIVIAIIRVGDAIILVNINSILIVVGGVVATGFIDFTLDMLVSDGTSFQNSFKSRIYEHGVYVDNIMRLAFKYHSGKMKKPNWTID
jgi:flagellar motor component MotA